MMLLCVWSASPWAWSWTCAFRFGKLALQFADRARVLFVESTREILECPHRFLPRLSFRESREGQREKIHGRRDFFREAVPEPGLGLREREHASKLAIDE